MPIKKHQELMEKCNQELRKMNQETRKPGKKGGRAKRTNLRFSLVLIPEFQIIFIPFLVSWFPDYSGRD